MKIIDFRSDTVTMPTEEMRSAMANAVVGDDVYNDDPTTKKLEELAASVLGMEKALFVPSGTFGNQLAVLTHTNHGEEIIMASEGHIRKYESGGAALISGVMIRGLNTVEGMMDLDELSDSIREDDIHYPVTSLICLENACGDGNVLTVEYMEKVSAIAKKNGVKVHLDGARVFNAATYLGVDVKEITKHVDSVQICLSKGLCAPVGSLLVGSEEFIAKALRYRKMLGGGLRQSGVLAAAGIIGIEKMSKRLDIDHKNARYLADELNKFDFIDVKYKMLKISMVFFALDNSVISNDDFTNHILKSGIKISPSDGLFRFVTHNDVDISDIDYLISVISQLNK